MGIHRNSANLLRCVGILIAFGAPASANSNATLEPIVDGFVAACNVASEVAEPHRDVSRSFDPRWDGRDIVNAYGAATETSCTEAAGLMVLCSTLWNEGYVDAAIAVALDGRRRWPQDPDWHLRLGKLFLETGDHAASVASYLAAVGGTPQDVDTVTAVAIGLAVSGACEQSEKYIRLWIDMAPDDVRPYFLLGDSLELRGEWAGAIAVYEKARETFPDNLAAASRLANARNTLRAGDWVVTRYGPDELRSDIEKAEMRAEHDDQNPDVHVALGKTYRRGGLLGKAVAAYKQALRLEPTHGEGRFSLGMLRADQERYEEAIAHYEAAIAGGVSDPQLYQYLGSARLRAGDPAGAQRALERAIALASEEKNPNNPSLVATFQMDLARVLYHQQEYRAAWELVQGAYAGGYPASNEPPFVRRLRAQFAQQD